MEEKERGEADHVAERRRTNLDIATEVKVVQGIGDEAMIAVDQEIDVEEVEAVAGTEAEVNLHIEEGGRVEVNLGKR